VTKTTTASGASWSILTVLLLVNILNFVDRQLPYILAEAIKQDLGLSDTQLGLLTGLAFAICYSLAALPLAWLADRWSPKRVLVLSIGFWSLMTGLGGLARNFIQLSLTRTGVALGEAGSTPSAHALISRLLPPGSRGKALGIFAMGAPIGSMLGLAGGGWLADVADWRTALLVAGAAGFVVVLLVILYVPDAKPVPVAPAARRSPWASVKLLFTSPTFVWLFVSMCLIGLCGYPFLVFSAPYLIRIQGLSAAEAGLFLGLMQGILGILGTVLGGVFFDRSVRKPSSGLLFWPALCLLAAAPLTLAGWFADGPTWALVLIVPMGFALTFYVPAIYGGAHIIAGPGNEATASSLLIIGAGIIGGALGPVAIGVISDALAPTMGINSLRWALIFVPVTTVLAGLALLRADWLLRLRPAHDQD
jgi:predicted MFS family arabinose efflux permease